VLKHHRPHCWNARAHDWLSPLGGKNGWLASGLTLRMCAPCSTIAAPQYQIGFHSVSDLRAHADTSDRVEGRSRVNSSEPAGFEKCSAPTRVLQYRPGPAERMDSDHGGHKILVK